jgi:hypothetical protein
MAELVVLRALYIRQKVRVRYVSGNFVGMDKERLYIGNIAKAASYLINEHNFTLRSEDSDEDGVTMIFYRETTTPPTSGNPIVPILEARLYSNVTILTDAGDISGTLTIIGEDFVQVTEDSGNVVLIPIDEINGVE